MNDLQAPAYAEHRSRTVLLPVAVAISLVLTLGLLVWVALLQRRLSGAEQRLANADKAAALYQERLSAFDARSRATSTALAAQLGTTKALMDTRSQELLLRQQTDASRLSTAQREAERRINANVSSVRNDVGSVRTDVSGVRTDIGGVKNDLGATRADLADTRLQLQRTIGDAGVMSGLIARNHEEVEQLRLRGERTYYEFTLQKGAPSTLLSSIRLQLKRADAKKNRYTLTVNADDRVIEKKDKTVDEPVQFYSGKTPALFEVVVNNVTKNSASGYLSVPKGL